MSQPHIIAFVGPVGSGKSTQMKLLASDTKTSRLKTKITFLKTGHLFAYILEVILVRVLIGKRKNVHPIRVLIEDRPDLFKKVFKLWLFLDILSIYLKFLLTIYLPMKMDYTVLVEEYIPATIADYIYLSRAIGFSFRASSFALNFMLRLLYLGGSTKIIFLDANTNALKSRWIQRGSLDEKSDYLHMQRTLLLSLSKKVSSHELLYINTSDQTIEGVHKAIVNLLMRAL